MTCTRPGCDGEMLVNRNVCAEHAKPIPLDVAAANYREAVAAHERASREAHAALERHIAAEKARDDALALYRVAKDVLLQAAEGDTA